MSCATPATANNNKPPKTRHKRSGSSRGPNAVSFTRFASPGSVIGLSDKICHIRSPIVMTKQFDFSGIWHSTYHFISTLKGSEGQPVTSEHDVKWYQTGNQLIGQ